MLQEQLLFKPCGALVVCVLQCVSCAHPAYEPNIHLVPARISTYRLLRLEPRFQLCLLVLARLQGLGASYCAAVQDLLLHQSGQHCYPGRGHNLEISTQSQFGRVTNGAMITPGVRALEQVMLML